MISLFWLKFPPLQLKASFHSGGYFQVDVCGKNSQKVSPPQANRHPASQRHYLSKTCMLKWACMWRCDLTRSLKWHRAENKNCQFEVKVTSCCFKFNPPRRFDNAYLKVSSQELTGQVPPLMTYSKHRVYIRTKEQDYIIFFPFRLCSLSNKC